MVLLEERRERVLVLTLNRPDVRNAINRRLAEALLAAIDRASSDQALDAVVIGAQGPVWAAGGDLDELSAAGFDQEGAEAVLHLGGVTAAIEDCAVPVVAAVGGPVIGGGSELLMACDVSVLEAGASVRFVHAELGLVPAWGGTTRLLERVGATRAAELLLTARTIEAHEAIVLGLATRRVGEGEAEEEAMAIARRMSSLSREAVVRMKRSLLAVRKARRGDALEAERIVFRDAWGSVANRAALGRRGVR